MFISMNSKIIFFIGGYLIEVLVLFKMFKGCLKCLIAV
jgi:hypothetical protein